MRFTRNCARYEALREQFVVQESLTALQAQRPRELEREIRERALRVGEAVGIG